LFVFSLYKERGRAGVVLVYSPMAIAKGIYFCFILPFVSWYFKLYLIRYHPHLVFIVVRVGLEPTTWSR